MSETRQPGSNPPVPDKTRLVFGFTPSIEGDRTRQALVDLCRFLGDAVGMDVAPMRVASYAALERAIVEGRASFGWFPPVVLARLELAGRLLPIAQCIRAGSSSYHACVIARQDAPFDRLDQVRDLRAVWVDRNSAAGYVFPRLLFAAQGIDPALAFVRETFAGSHAEVVRSVVDGDADVGATFASLREGVLDAAGRPQVIRGGWTDPDGKGARPVKFLETFGPIPNDAMAVSTALDANVAQALTRATLAASSTPALKSALRHLFGADSLGPVGPGTYDALRALVSRALRNGIVLSGA